jgi:hypothetical protein
MPSGTVIFEARAMQWIRAGLLALMLLPGGTAPGLAGTAAPPAPAAPPGPGHAVDLDMPGAAFTMDRAGAQGTGGAIGAAARRVIDAA